MDVLLNKELHRCGKRVYVNYFEFWDKVDFDEQPIRDQMKLVSKEENGIRMCIQAARKIAEHGLQKEALMVIANSPRVDLAAREKAQLLLRAMK